MIVRKSSAVGILIGVAAGTSVLVTAAFARPPKHAKKPPVKTVAPAAAIAAGKKVYAAKFCAGCHAINGTGGKNGPDLSAAGADSEHTVKWMSDQVSNPKGHKPDSTMPPYADKIKGKDLTNLATYLSSLKKAAKPTGK